MIKKIKAFDGSGKSGFTLIEMLIVIAVIAVLAGVVLTGVSGFQASARDTSRIGDLRNTQNYLELFFNRCGHYPVDGSGDCGSPGSQGQLDESALETALLSVTSQVPGDPVGTSPYVYEYGYSDTGLNYVLKATMERDNSALNDDIDGSVLGVDCVDPAFCIQS